MEKCVRCGITTAESVSTEDGPVCGSHFLESELVAEIRHRDVLLLAARTTIRLRDRELVRLERKIESYGGRLLTASVRRGLYLWFWHCRAIWDDKEAEYGEAVSTGDETELTAREFADMKAALAFMFGPKPAGPGEIGDGDIR